MFSWSPHPHTRLNGAGFPVCQIEQNGDVSGLTNQTKWRRFRSAQTGKMATFPVRPVERTSDAPSPVDRAKWRRFRTGQPAKMAALPAWRKRAFPAVGRSRTTRTTTNADFVPSQTTDGSGHFVTPCKPRTLNMNLCTESRNAVPQYTYIVNTRLSATIGTRQMLDNRGWRIIERSGEWGFLNYGYPF